MKTTVPFKGAASEKRLLSWLKKLAPNGYKLLNQVDHNLKLAVTLADIRGVPVVALGSVASQVLKDLNVNHFKLPHPSGRNRMLNNKALVAKKLKECKNWLAGR